MEAKNKTEGVVPESVRCICAGRSVSTPPTPPPCPCPARLGAPGRRAGSHSGSGRTPIGYINNYAKIFLIMTIVPVVAKVNGLKREKVPWSS